MLPAFCPNPGALALEVGFVELRVKQGLRFRVGVSAETLGFGKVGLMELRVNFKCNDPFAQQRRV